MEENENGQPLHDFSIEKYDGEQVAIYSWADTAQAIGEVKWLWPGWLANGFVHMLCGESGIGKSAIELLLTKTFTTGCNWPDGTPYESEVGPVLWCDSEAAQAINTQRAIDWNIPLNRILCHEAPIDDFSYGDDDKWNKVVDIINDDRVKLAVFDSLSGMHEDEESKARMAGILKDFALLARDANKPLVIAHHARKLADNKPNVMTLSRVRGSGTIVQYCRVVMAIDAPNEDDEEHRRLLVLKSNMVGRPEALGFMFRDDGTLEFTARVPEEQERKARKWKQDRAYEYMNPRVEIGGKVSPELFKETMKQVDCSESTTYKAKRRIEARQQ